MTDDRSSRPSDNDHWLTRPSSIRRLWIGFGIVLALTVVAQFAVTMEGSFGIDADFGFGAWFGFLSCVAMVLLAKVLGWVIKRPESYYGEDVGSSSTEDDRA